MPTFDFQCVKEECNFVFEAFLLKSSDAYPLCPQCGAEVRKCISAPTVHFKGSGFYSTDTRADKEVRESAKKHGRGCGCCPE